MRIDALEPRELALVMADTVVPYFLARSQTVSPAVTVWVPAAFVAADAGVAAVTDGMVRVWPMTIMALPPRWLASTMRWTEVP
ncbi:hypothetical protein [Demequina litorisediminis]|uniref:Uncharacterized protein n=1 Tax=Demequina litorisediminis TaxID=1849022 RepID=A0ABQ6IAC6_9MICO|nr:hypothetical protein [Demequina litorisediminis]GMA33952.1 hypothetical protein GCM10025876_01560 [Demequina litorisediminis]